MRAVAHALLELSLVGVIVAVVCADPAPLSRWTGGPSADEQLLASSCDANDQEVEQALRRGASVAARDFCGVTPLHYAAASGDTRLVRRLIERGADVNAINNGRSTPLMSAAVHDHAEVVQILLRAGASPSDRVLDAVVLVGATGAERVLREWRVAAGQTG